MRKIFPVFSALVITVWAADVLVCPLAYAQNEIDYVNSYYWSGYGKMAIDRDTLYLNSLNGHGVERYYIADPANPQFIDRTQISGFDQIDFDRRLMADFRGGRIFLIDFEDFANVQVVSSIDFPLQLHGNLWPSWQLKHNYLLLALEDDSLRVFDIADPANPTLSSVFNLNRHSELPPYSHYIQFGSTVCIDMLYVDYYFGSYQDIYDITDPENVQLSDSNVVWYYIESAVGDTFCTSFMSIMFSWYTEFVSFAPNDTSHLPYWWGGSYGNWPPAVFYGASNGFVLNREWRGSTAYSYRNFNLLGIAPEFISDGRFSYNFNCTADDYFLTASRDSLRVFQPTYDTTAMPQVAVFRPPHFGILSAASYGNYILSGAESNGGELLVHELSQNGQVDLVSTLPGVEAKEVIIDSSSALCLCPNEIIAVDISTPISPSIMHRVDGFNGALADFSKQDSLLYVVTDHAYSIVSYHFSTGFILRCTLDLPGAPLTSIEQYSSNSYILKGSVGIVVKVSSFYGSNPRIEGEYRLPHENYKNLDRFYQTLFASCEDGTDVVQIGDLEPVAFFGPEYFSDARRFHFSNDTFYVADGFAGLKVFRFHWSPFDSLHYIGGYSTGNVVSQVATIGDNFFLADYYSLQHLRWGAPTGVVPDDENPLPNEIALYQNYPNPFNARTTIEYYLPKAGRVTIDIFDIMGRKVQTLIDAVTEAGRHAVVWDAGDRSSGVYFYRMNAGEQKETRKCLLMK